jgi:dUTP pyrophosphatase|tara:strand:- start:159 stop:602 length:444 start_codon:yes stop_codon:yes gene_type:complete
MKTKVLIKKLYSDVNIPAYKTSGSSGLDLEAFIEEDLVLKPNNTTLVPTGLSVAIEDDLEIQIRPRSGLAAKNMISVLNTPGTIDSDYRGEIKVILINLGKDNFIIKKGDRIAQMVVCPIIKANFEIVNELPETLRGTSGFGSTGKN